MLSYQFGWMLTENMVTTNRYQERKNSYEPTNTNFSNHQL